MITVDKFSYLKRVDLIDGGNSMKATKCAAMFLSLILSVEFHCCCYKNKSTELRIAKSLCKSRESGSFVRHALLCSTMRM